MVGGYQGHYPFTYGMALLSSGKKMNSVKTLNSIEMSSTDHPLRVMIVDDHELFRHGLRDLINSIEGFQVIAEASFCNEALTLAKHMHIDLVMLDMYLQDGNGIQVTHQLRQEFTPSPRVIILSAMVYDDLLLEAILAGAHGYLTKDMSRGEITNALLRFQQGELALLPATTASLVHLLVQKYQEVVAELATYQQGGNLTAKFPSPRSSESNQVESASSTAISLFTPQESKVFQLLRHGKSNKQIAAQLSISPYTVGKHIQNILRKLGVANRTQAVAYTLFEGGDNFKDE